MITDPVTIPGTLREYPNWRRKQRRETRRIFDDPAVAQRLDAVGREREISP